MINSKKMMFLEKKKDATKFGVKLLKGRLIKFLFCKYRNTILLKTGTVKPL